MHSDVLVAVSFPTLPQNVVANTSSVPDAFLVDHTFASLNVVVFNSTPSARLDVVGNQAPPLKSQPKPKWNLAKLQ